MSRIFLSHSSTDNAEVVALRDWFAAQGFDEIFLDLDATRGLKAGERWEQALIEAASRCEAVVFLISRGWIASGWCRKEMSLAHRLNKRMFGVLIEDLPVEDVPKDLSGEWQLVRLASGRDGMQLQAVLPVTHDEETVTFSAEGLQRLKHGLESAGLNPKYFAWPPADDPTRPPYRGFLPLEAEDAGIFFGRNAETVTALDTLRGLREAAPPRLFVILGASGAGKSSMLRAGLIPRLKRDERHFLPLPVIRPERAAITGEAGLLRALEGALKVHGIGPTRAEIGAIVDGNAEALASLLGQLCAKAIPFALTDVGAPPKPPTLVLSIDQGEELFNADGAAESRQLLSLLAGLVTAPAPDVIALFTIRTDAYEPLQSAVGPAAPLADLKQVTLSLPPMAQGAYQSVIEGPAARLTQSGRKLDIAPDLTAALLRDIEGGGAKDALPLLAFALERLYLEHGGDGNLTLAKYQAFGGIKGAIEAAVATAFKEADADPAIPRDADARRRLLRRGLIPWLAGIEPDTGMPRRKVARLSQIPRESRPLIDLLVKVRLLATDRDAATGEATIEPAHEALLRQWGLLEGWLEEDFAALATLEGVNRAARDWEANGQRAAWLAHGGTRLEEAERTAALPAFADYLAVADRDYLAAARKAEMARMKRERFLNRAIRVAAVLALIAAGVAAWQAWLANTRLDKAVVAQALAETEGKRAEEALDRVTAEKKRADQQRSRFLAEKAREANRAHDYTTATLFALEALPSKSSGKEHAHGIPVMLHRALTDLRHIAVLRGHEKAVLSAAFSPDGRAVVTASRDATARLWDAATGKQIAVLKGHCPSGVDSGVRGCGVVSAAFSPDGRTVLTASGDGTARLWEAATGKEMAVLKGHEQGVWSAAFSRDGRRVVTASDDTTARVWDAATGQAIVVLKGHKQGVTSAAFSPDGRTVVTASLDGTARLWDAATGKESAVLKGHEGIVTSATLSPDGRTVATASDDATARLWEVATGQQIAVLKGHEQRVGSAAFSPDGRTVVTASDDTTARLWEAATGQQIAVLGEKGAKDDGVGSAVFSPDGRTVVTASLDGTARLWEAATGKEIAVLRGHEKAVWSAAFSPDGRTVVTASLDGTARLWNAAIGEEIAVLKGHCSGVLGSGVRGSGVGSATFSPDGRTVVTTSSDATARLWEAATGKEIAVLKGWHWQSVESAAFSPDSKTVVTASRDGTAWLWEAATGEPIAILKGHAATVWSAAFSPDGRTVVTASEDNTARLWEVATGQQIAVLKEIAVLKGHEKGVTSASFSPDGRVVVTASWDGTARLWETATAKEIAVLKGHGQSVESAAFSPDGRTVVTASLDATARLWDVATGREMSVLKGHEKEVLSAAFSPDGRTVVTASWDGTARLWEAATGKEIAVLKGHEKGVTSSAFSPDGRTVVTASWDATARLWDAATGKAIAVLRGHEKPVWSAALSPDGRTVVTASWDATARLWDAATGDAIAVLKGQYYPSGVSSAAAGCGVASAAFSPDDRTVLTTSSDGTAQLWEAATGIEIAVLMGHEKKVERAVFSRDGRRVVTASDDTTARVWDAATGKEIAVLKGHEKGVTSAAFSPDGRTVVTASLDDTARLWDVATGNEIAVLRLHVKPVLSAAFSPDGRTVVTASGDTTARMWEVATGKQIAVLNGHEEGVTSAAFSPDGRTVVTASLDGTARLWEVATFDRLTVLKGHEKAVQSAAFSRDGKTVVTASDDNTARLWEAATGKEIAVLKGHSDVVRSAAFSREGRTVITASKDGTARLWPVVAGSVQALVEAAIERVPQCLTSAQRDAAFLDPKAPDWCYELGKWPYKPRRYKVSP